MLSDRAKALKDRLTTERPRYALLERSDRAKALADRTSCCQTDILTEKSVVGQYPQQQSYKSRPDKSG